MSSLTSTAKQLKIASLKRLIEHPATPATEVEAAKLALARILGSKQPIKRESVADIFRKNMRKY